VFLDITERKLTEKSLAEHAAKLEAANKELESFSYSVSHDLRAPLRAINGYAQMILRKGSDRFDEEVRRRFEMITNNAEKMGQLIDDLLAFSRLGSQDVVKLSLDMEELIGEVWQELRNINPCREMTLKICKMPAVCGDSALIRQVYSNLLGNAVKFTQGENMAMIEAGSCTQDGESVYYIRDNGVGFDMRFYDKLFGVFQRLHSDAEYKGTGIGLALVKRIINRHGGRVWAEGKVDEGATFYFTLPTRQG
jgi:light-regulated signal transduction histidine kinase (bacteriophytochrome)